MAMQGPEGVLGTLWPIRRSLEIENSSTKHIVSISGTATWIARRSNGFTRLVEENQVKKDHTMSCWRFQTRWNAADEVCTRRFASLCTLHQSADGANRSKGKTKQRQRHTRDKLQMGTDEPGRVPRQGRCTLGP